VPARVLTFQKVPGEIHSFCISLCMLLMWGEGVQRRRRQSVGAQTSLSLSFQAKPTLTPLVSPKQCFFKSTMMLLDTGINQQKVSSRSNGSGSWKAVEMKIKIREDPRGGDHILNSPAPLSSWRECFRAGPRPVPLNQAEACVLLWEGGEEAFLGVYVALFPPPSHPPRLP